MENDPDATLLEDSSADEGDTEQAGGEGPPDIPSWFVKLANSNRPFHKTQGGLSQLDLPPEREAFPAHPDLDTPLLPEVGEGGVPTGYTQSFRLGEDSDASIRVFFQEHGFVVVRGVLSPEGCAESRRDIMSLMQDSTGGAFRGEDPATWHNWPPDSLEHYGSPHRSPIFRHRFLENRQLPGVLRAHAILFGTDDLVVNHDRCCMFRPTEGHPEWVTKGNVHLDMNPWDYLRPPSESQFRQQLTRLSYERVGHFIYENNLHNHSDGLSVQCVLNLNDNLPQDGGFVTVPGFANRFGEVFSLDDRHKHKKVAYGFPKNTDVARAAGRVAMREGSIVIWDQRMAHGSYPNRSSRPRFAQFLKLHPKSGIEAARYKRRAKILQRIIMWKMKEGFEVNEAGQKLFQVDAWELPHPNHPCHTAVRPLLRPHDPLPPELGEGPIEPQQDESEGEEEFGLGCFDE